MKFPRYYSRTSETDSREGRYESREMVNYRHLDRSRFDMMRARTERPGQEGVKAAGK